jgi:hypothetical protein
MRPDDEVSKLMPLSARVSVSDATAVLVTVSSFFYLRLRTVGMQAIYFSWS